QLEMLCNIAAAEITMPIGDVSRMISGALTIEQLMHLRREFDVSAEATLIRVAKITDEPVMAFCASRIGGEDPDGFRLDYVVRSRTCPLPTATGSVVGPSSVLREC